MTVAALIDEGRRDGVFTHASLCVVRDGKVLLEAGDPGVYDVASVTKVVTAVLAHRHLPIDRKVEWIQGLPTIGQLLSHSSGLPAWRPLFAHAAAKLGVDFAHALPVEEIEQIYRDVIAATPADAPRPTYSDLGFFSLGLELQAATGHSLDELMRWICRPDRAFPTGLGRPRPWNPDVERELVDRLGRDATLDDGLVDDDNAAMAGGLAGHAGLFATAPDVAQLGDAIRRAADDGDRTLCLAPESARLLFTRVSGSRTCGLDTPSGDLPSIGTILGRGPKGAAGHLGFTGCSLWIDRDARVSIALLSNAVLLERPSAKIRVFRPKLHDAVARELRLG